MTIGVMFLNGSNNSYHVVGFHGNREILKDHVPEGWQIKDIENFIAVRRDDLPERKWIDSVREMLREMTADEGIGRWGAIFIPIAPAKVLEDWDSYDE